MLSLPLFNLTRLTMVLKKALIFSCLLKWPVLGQASSFRVDKRGAELGEHFHFVEKDKPQRQTSAFPADLQDTSAAHVLTKTMPEVSSSSGGTPVSCSNHKEKAENPNQQSQKINDKYPSYISLPETMFCDLFRLHEQYFEFQEKYFCTSITNVKGRLTENIGFWRSMGDNPEILKILQEGYNILFFESPEE